MTTDRAQPPAVERIKSRSSRAAAYGTNVEVVGLEAEDEDVLLADMFEHLDIGAVERADGERAVERELQYADPLHRKDLARGVRDVEDLLLQ